MIKYKIVLPDSVIEFATESEAQSYKTANNLEESIEEFNDEPASFVFIPDVTPRQIRSALILNGITEQQVIESFNVLEEPNKSLAIVGWEYSLSFVRNEPAVDLIGEELGVTSEWIDNLWLLAATL